MATVINNPPSQQPIQPVQQSSGDSASSNGLWAVLLVIVVALLLYLAFARGYFHLRSASPTVNVPGQIDVNVNKGNNPPSNQSGGSTNNSSGGTNYNTGSGQSSTQ